MRRALLIHWLKIRARLGHSKSRRRLGQYLRVRKGSFVAPVPSPDPQSPIVVNEHGVAS